MQAIETKLESKVKFWAVLGPFILLLTLFVTLVKASPSCLYMPLATLVGIPICWKWRMNGLLLSISTLALLFALCYGHMPVEERFWQAGMAMAIAMSFVVTTLSFEEVSALVTRQSDESGSRLKSILQLDEKLRSVQEMWRRDREDLSVRLRVLTKESRGQKAQLSHFNELSAAVHEELNKAYEQKERFLLETFESGRREMQLQSALEEKEAELAHLRQSLQLSQSEREQSIAQDLEDLRENHLNYDANIALMRKEISELEAQKADWQAHSHSQSSEEAEELRRRLHEQVHRADALQARLDQELETRGHMESQTRSLVEERKHLEASLGNEIFLAKKKVEALQKEKQVLQEQLHDHSVSEEVQAKKEEAKGLRNELNNVRMQKYQMKLDMASRENRIRDLRARLRKKEGQQAFLLEGDEKQLADLRRSDAMYKQLMKQFAEKSDILHQTRKELFRTEGLLHVMEHEREERERFEYPGLGQRLERYLLRSAEEHSRSENNLNDEVLALQELVASLLEQIASVSKG